MGGRGMPRVLEEEVEEGGGGSARVTGSLGLGRGRELDGGGELGGLEEGESGGETGGDRQAPAERSDAPEEDATEDAEVLRERGGVGPCEAMLCPDEVRDRAALVGCGGGEPNRREREKRERCRVLR